MTSQHTYRTVDLNGTTNVASVTASQAFAQTQIDVFTGLTNQGFSNGDTLVSAYTFNQSMILNSIGFVSGSNQLTTISYTLDSAATNLLMSNLSDVDVNGLRWYTLPNGGLSVNALSKLLVTASTTLSGEGGPITFNSYVRVDSINTSSNVAPEPGSFALALFGGAALIGICIRRRRNAA